jgi:hypothetical protein
VLSAKIELENVEGWKFRERTEMRKEKERRKRKRN